MLIQFRIFIALLLFMNVINFLIIFPIIFHLFIIDKIQKRISERLIYKMSIYKWQIFAKWFVPPLEIAQIIVIQFFIWKIKKHLPGKIWGYNPSNNFALSQVHYDIRQASRFEIVASFLAMINIFCAILIGILHTLIF